MNLFNDVSRYDSAFGGNVMLVESDQPSSTERLERVLNTMLLSLRADWYISLIPRGMPLTESLGIGFHWARILVELELRSLIP